MRINSTGNVGIGTTAPQAVLHVNGDTTSPVNNLLGSNIYWDFAQSRFEYIGNGIGGIIKPANPGIGMILSVFPENFAGAGASAATRYDAISVLASNGNVGIGTTTPQARLEVAGSVSATEVKVSSSGQACGATNVGTLRWNAAKGRPEMCFPDTP